MINKPTHNALQLTVAIIKPHILQAPHLIKAIREIILSNKFYVIRTKRTKLTGKLAGELYVEHKNKFFYNRLITFMCSGPIDVHVLAHHNAIQLWRDLMGPTKSYQARFTSPDTIRGKHGLSDTRNAVHGSDSPESAEKEALILFPEFSIRQWYKDEEKYFINGKVVFNKENFVHRAA
ncbi:nucleoside diphosphate kinase 6-like [Bacillus rossius redtenbacheri]|uniref:nucleoside diphosphate kinase 6-like n=1 Tax=Bacillus rossius redtenbacheri TaxID=93214 RepID=UPI002FDE6B00